MSNEYIEVVKRWKAGEEVSQTELEDNAEAAWAAYDANTYCWAKADYVATEAAITAAVAVDAAEAAEAGESAEAAKWIKRYEELTNDK